MLACAIDITHEHSLDLVGITLASDPPVIETVSVDRHLYKLRSRATRAASAKKRGGVISDCPLKEYKFCLGVAKHNLIRKANGMMEYVGG
jgi:translation initiation factor IF-3